MSKGDAAILVSTWEGPCSVCTCGHTGDGSGSEHGVRFGEGHGSCSVSDCGCVQFSWVDWTPDLQKSLDALQGH